MIFKTNIAPLDKKRLAKYFGMSISNPALPESIKNIFYMYYIPTENETYRINDRKEAAFFGMTLLCVLNRNSIEGDCGIESKLKYMMDTSDSDKRKIESIFRANITSTSELITVLGPVCKKDSNLTSLQQVNINWLIGDLIKFGNPDKNDEIKQKWAIKIFNIIEGE